jgi:hypothetical protein
MNREQQKERLAIDVMGWKKCLGCFNPYCNGWKGDNNSKPPDNWNPFHNWSHTGMLLGRMLELGFLYEANVVSYGRAKGLPEIGLIHEWRFWKARGQQVKVPESTVADDIKEAICCASLVAVKGE